MPTELKRTLSLSLVTFYGIGTILGAGIYVLVGKVAGLSGMYAPIAFLLASLLAALSALSYAELSARFPQSAGEAIYVQEAFGRRFLSITVGVAIVFAGIISVATLILGFVGYFQVFIEMPNTIVVVTVTLLMGLIVAWGINQSVIIASVMTLLEIFGLLLIIWIARENFGILPERWPELLPPMEVTAWGGIIAGSFIAFYAFIGFEDIVNVAEEVRNPRKNLPRAIIIALVVTSLFYFIVSLLSIVTLPPQQLAQTEAPLADLYHYVTGKQPIAITVISLVSVLNGVLIQLIMASRILFGMSRQGWLPAFLGKVNSITRTPLFATAIVTTLVLLFALCLPLISLAALTSYIILSVFTLINLSLWRFKNRDAKPEGILIIPKWVPILGFFCSAAAVCFQTVSVLFD